MSEQRDRLGANPSGDDWLRRAAAITVASIAAGAFPLGMQPKHASELRSKLYAAFRRNVGSYADWKAYESRVLKAANYHGRYAALLTVGKGVGTGGKTPLRDLDADMTALAGYLVQSWHCGNGARGIPCDKIVWLSDEQAAALGDAAVALVPKIGS